MKRVFPDCLDTPRLVLRRLQDDDAFSISGYRSLPEVARYQSWEFFSPEDAVRLIADQHDRDIGIPGTWLQLVIVEACTGTVAGDCGIHCFADDAQQLELGITLAPGGQGRGYAAEALACLIQWVFTNLDTHRVSAVTDDQNVPAAALFRRLGFRQEAHHLEHRRYKGTWTSEFVFALLRREWNDVVSRGGGDDIIVIVS